MAQIAPDSVESGLELAADSVESEPGIGPGVVLEPSRADPPDLVEARAAWRVCAAALAQQPRMRVSLDGGRTFTGRGLRVLTGELPASRPVAVPTYDKHGMTRLLAIDLDAKRGDVDADAAAIAEQLRACGARLVEDVSPSGGRHLYVRLADPVSVADMVPVVRGIQARHSSVDILPMVNAAAGCIRPPGSRHRSGGWQRLTTALPDAISALSLPADATVWAAIQARYAPYAPTTLAEPVTAATAPDSDQVDEVRATLPLRYARIALTGDWTGYTSPSEARQGVVWAAVATGLSLPQVAHRIAAGAWPGLAGLYRRYGGHQHRALARDWHEASRFQSSRIGRAPRSDTQGLDTRGHLHSGGAVGEHQAVREWLWAVSLVAHRWQQEPLLLLVLRAMGQAAQQTGSTVVERGVRGLAIATQYSHGAVAAALVRLRDEPDPVLQLVQARRGVRADVYELRIPDAVGDRASRRPWRAGTTRALPAFARELGRVAGWVWEVIRAAGSAVAALEVARLVPYEHRAIGDALRALAAHGLVQRTPAGWEIGPVSSDTVAIATGADLHHQAVVDYYQAQRQAWHAWLGRFRVMLSTHTLPSATAPPSPTDAAEALIRMILGGVEEAA